jgi:DNA-binding MurR/RpiR family transcriptional regulator/CubicO group peptidase (beta-lactamase class C family)
MESLQQALTSGLSGRPHPLYAGAVGLVLRGGVVFSQAAVGQAVRYADGVGTPLPEDEQIAMRTDTIFDLASLTKLFTTTLLLGLVDGGALSLDAPIHPHLPTFASGIRRSVSMRHLLTHTSGLPALLNLWTDWSDVAARRAAVLGVPLERSPGAAFSYSDLGFIVAGFLAEEITGMSLAELVSERVCRPLGMTDTGFLPAAASRDRIAATEDEAYAGRGMLRGSVHDENAWSLGGAVGHAGVFGTAGDLARLGEALRLGGALDGVRILKEETVGEMLRDQLPDWIDPGFRQGLGVRITDPASMGPLSGPRTVGHTGFTGTSLVIDRDGGRVVVLLTNRVHPSRTWSDVGVMRRRVAAIAADGTAEGVASLPRRRAPAVVRDPERDSGPRTEAGRGLLVRIRAELPGLRPAERRVALAVLDDPAGVAQRSIGVLARQCDTSGTTVLRFCRAVGYRHYPDLRIDLARETSREEAGNGPGPLLTGDISPTDTLAEIVAKIAWSDARAIEDTAATLDMDTLGRAIDAVTVAERVDIYGIGASGFVAQDLHQKLHRIGLLSSVWPDPHAALTSAALLGPSDVAIAISHTGTTIDTIEALRVAESRGATTIAITNFGDSPLAGHARLVLTTAARETTFRSGAMASRIAQLAVVDCLFVGVAQRSYERTMLALERTFAAVQGRRTAPLRSRSRRSALR